MPPKADVRGVLRSQVFPGMWLDTRATLKGDLKKLLATLRAAWPVPHTPRS